MSKTVLIVEDNVLNMKLFNDVLEAQGYHILQAVDGGQVLKLVREHRPDLILMDIQLPRLSGFELTQQLKEDEELRSIPIIALTAFAMKGDEDRIREAGCDAYLSKPITVANFLKVVAQFLEPVAA